METVMSHSRRKHNKAHNHTRELINSALQLELTQIKLTKKQGLLQGQDYYDLGSDELVLVNSNYTAIDEKLKILEQLIETTKREKDKTEDISVKQRLLSKATSYLQGSKSIDFLLKLSNYCAFTINIIKEIPRSQEKLHNWDRSGSRVKELYA
jgi:hypothetical protein